MLTLYSEECRDSTNSPHLAVSFATHPDGLISLVSLLVLQGVVLSEPCLYLYFILCCFSHSGNQHVLLIEMLLVDIHFTVETEQFDASKNYIYSFIF